MRMSTCSITLGLGLCVGLTACINDPTDDGAATDEVTLDLNMAGGVTITGGTTGRMGKLTEQSCFLSGVRGNLDALPPQEAVAEVFPGSDGYWRAHATAGVTAVATCVNYPYPGESMELLFENNTTGGQVFSQAHRRCFLRRVGASIGFEHNIEESLPPKLAISNEGAQWGWGDSFMSESVEDGHVYGEAKALCIDAPGSSFAWGIPVQGFVGVSNTTPLKDSHGDPISTAGTECALSEISGRWDLSDPFLGSNVGVTLSNAGTSWTVTTAGNRAARISCWR